MKFYTNSCGVWWYMLIIPATWEVEIKRLVA
jgi:hypothetical protein